MADSQISHMTLEEIDKALAEWDAKRSVATDNILELMDMLTYKRLTGTNGLPMPQLSGITEQRVTPALKALDELWVLFGELNKVIDRAKDIRKSLPRNPKKELVEIEDLLTGPSVKFAV